MVAIITVNPHIHISRGNIPSDAMEDPTMGADKIKHSINLARDEDDKLRHKYQAQKAQDASDEAEQAAKEMVEAVTPSEHEAGSKPASGV